MTTENHTVRPTNLKISIFFAFCYAFSSALTSLFVKLIGEQLPTSLLLFFRFAFSLVLLLPFLMYDKAFTLKIQKPVGYITRILASLLGIFLLYYSLKFIPLVDALLLNNTAPLFVPIMAFLITHAKTPKKVYFGITVGFIGVVFILQPTNHLFEIPSLIALASGVLYALAIVQAKIISKTSSNNQMFFCYYFVSTLVSGIFALMQWKTPIDWSLWLLIIGMAVSGAICQVSATLCWVRAPVRITAPFSFTIVVFGGIFDWLIWGNIPTHPTIIGFVLVLCGTLMTLYFGRELILQKALNAEC